MDFLALVFIVGNTIPLGQLGSFSEFVLYYYVGLVTYSGQSLILAALGTVAFSLGIVKLRRARKRRASQNK